VKPRIRRNRPGAGCERIELEGELLLGGVDLERRRLAQRLARE